MKREKAICRQSSGAGQLSVGNRHRDAMAPAKHLPLFVLRVKGGAYEIRLRLFCGNGFDGHIGASSKHGNESD